MNTPYKKVYENGILTNPITKENPYISQITKDKKKVRKSNNTKGFRMICVRIGKLSFLKFHLREQLIKGKLITHSILNP